MVNVCAFEAGLDGSINPDQIKDALLAVGIRLMPVSEPSYRYAIVMFTLADEHLYNMLRDLCCGKNIHILALQVGHSIHPVEVWRMLEAGAEDVLVWSENQESAERVKARVERWMAIDELLDSDWVKKKMIGASPVWKKKLQQLIEAARFTTSPVLLMGESGTGKELAAHLIHQLTPSSDKGILHILDCTTIMPELSGSEFFGHERGAFTGAVAQREGAFALANGGTLFLDEIGELSLPLQAQLLRVIQEGKFKRVGGNSWMETSFRLVCATNCDLREQVQQGSFRGDLYFRIASLVHTLPPLRERTEDILPLARHFIGEYLPGQDPPELDSTVLDYLLRHEYCGNVRELKQRVARLMNRYVGAGLISAGNIPSEDRLAPDAPAADWQGSTLEKIIRRSLALGTGLKEISRTIEDLAVTIAVNDAEGNLQQASQVLGVTDRALQMRRAKNRQGR